MSKFYLKKLLHGRYIYINIILVISTINQKFPLKCLIMKKKKNLISNKSFETEQFTTVSCIYIGRIAWYNKIKI